MSPPHSARPPQRRKQELSRDNATLSATLQAARETLARVSELLQGMDRAKEVSTAPGAAPGAGPPGSRASGKGVGTGPTQPLCPQEYERLAASLDGARAPLQEKIRAFASIDSKVELVEAAEAHAWRLDQLAHNLSRCRAGRGCREGLARPQRDPVGGSQREERLSSPGRPLSHLRISGSPPTHT